MFTRGKLLLKLASMTSNFLLNDLSELFRGQNWQKEPEGATTVSM